MMTNTLLDVVFFLVLFSLDLSLIDCKKSNSRVAFLRPLAALGYVICGSFPTLRTALTEVSCGSLLLCVCWMMFFVLCITVATIRRRDKIKMISISLIVGLSLCGVIYAERCLVEVVFFVIAVFSIILVLSLTTEKDVSIKLNNWLETKVANLEGILVHLLDIIPWLI